MKNGESLPTGQGWIGDATVWGHPESFRLIDWKTDGFVTIETSVGHLSEAKRDALLRVLNVFAKVIEDSAVEPSPSGEATNSGEAKT